MISINVILLKNMVNAHCAKSEIYNKTLMKINITLLCF